MSTTRKPLIIAEKPSAARAIADALGGFVRRDGYLESPQYLLGWAIGHLVELMAPEDYDSRYKRWSLETLPITPPVFGLKVTPKTKAQFDLLARLARTAPELINACDAGREGELIFRYIYDVSGAKAPTRRLWVSALTKDAIRAAFRSLRPSTEFDRLYQSALCRAQGDWLVGMNSTRAFTVKWGELLSVGRVQTPTLALLVRREREIESFVPEQYWEVEALFAASERRTYEGKWLGPDGHRLKKAEEAQAIVDRVKGQPGQVESVEEKPVSERPPQLYDLTTLQREANRRFGLTAAATLKAAQSLYEDKLITYPRTDSRYLTKDLVKGLPAVVDMLHSVSDFRTAAAGADLGLVHPGNRRVVDDAKVTDHHAIIPTAEHPGQLTGVGAKIYGLIARRFLAQFYPEARFLETEVITLVGQDRFKSRGRRMLEPGWRAVEAEGPATKAKRDEDEEQAKALPPLKAGEGVLTKDAQALEKTTQPPKRFTEAALLSAMEFAGKELDDEALKEAMKGHGLGTPATRAAIIERLKDVEYIVADKKALVPTPKGRMLVERAEAAGASALLSAELTGGWEKRIADIQGGLDYPDRLMRSMRDLAVQVVEWVKQAEGGAAPVKRKRSGPSAPAEPGAEAVNDLPEYACKCPRCGRAVVKGSKGWLCTSDECGLRVPAYLCGKVIDAPLVGAILQKGRSPLITGFKSPRTGKTFSAYLVLKDGKVEFEFPADRPKKASGYRRAGGTDSTRGSASERTTAAKTGSRASGRSAATGAAAQRRSAAGAGVGGRAPRASKPAGTRTRSD